MTYFQTHIKKHKIIAYSNNAFSYRCGFLRQGAFLVPANLRHQELPRSSRLQNIAISVEPHSSMYDPVTSVTQTLQWLFKCYGRAMCVLNAAYYHLTESRAESPNFARNFFSRNPCHLGDDTTLSRPSFCSRTPCAASPKFV